MKAKPFNHHAHGFSIIQLLITIAVLLIIAGFAIVGITRGRDHVRVMNSAREFAGYVERARADAVRRHNTANVQVINETQYRVIMDFDGNGSIDVTDIRTFSVQPGVRFTTGIKGVAFDWRGRTTQEQSFGFFTRKSFSTSPTDGFTVSVGVTGSGDVTFDAQYFSDSLLPGVTYTGSPGGFIPDPGASPTPLGNPSPTPTNSPTPTPDPNASPTPTPTPTPTGYPSPTPTATATPYPSPTPTGSVSPNPSPTPIACGLNASPETLNVISDGSGTIRVNRANASGSATITATSSNNGQIQVTPSTQIVNGSSSAVFTVTVKKASGSVTFASSGCSSKTVTVNIQ